MILLALDCSGSACSTALFIDGEERASRFEVKKKGEGERLMCLIEEVLAEAAISASAITHVAVTTGPGSFSGVRTGLAAARGLSLALGVPVLGVSALALLASQEKGDGEITVTIPAGRGDVYSQRFSVRRGTLPAAAGEATITPASSEFAAAPHACGLADFASDPAANWGADLCPLYIRPPDAIAAAPLLRHAINT